MDRATTKILKSHELRNTVVIVLVVVLIRLFIFPVYQIPSSSMTGTLHIGDRVVVSKVSMLTGHVQHGDVVVFRDKLGWMSQGSNSGTWQHGGGNYLVKRVIGVSGDHVECCTPTGRLRVNGVEIQEDYVAQLPAAVASFDVKVPEGKLWMMGDNRSNSADSLQHLVNGDASPYVSEKDVVGPVWLVMWPMSRWKAGIGNRETFAMTENTR